jgi:hypothetical protein
MCRRGKRLKRRRKSRNEEQLGEGDGERDGKILSYVMKNEAKKAN